MKLNGCFVYALLFALLSVSIASARIYAGGVSGCGDLAVAANSDDYRGDGGNIFIHSVGWTDHTTEAEKDAIVSLWADRAWGIEMGHTTSNYTARQNAYVSRYLSRGIEAEFITVNCFSSSRVPDVTDWELTIQAYYDKGVDPSTPIYPTFEYQNMAAYYTQLHNNYVSDRADFQQLIEASGGLTIDIPPHVYFLRINNANPNIQKYHDWILDAIGWAHSQGHTVGIIVSPNNSKEEYDEETEAFVQILRDHDALPDFFVVENYSTEDPSTYENEVGNEDTPHHQLGCARLMQTDWFPSAPEDELFRQTVDLGSWSESATWNSDWEPLASCDYVTDLRLRTPGTDSVFGGRSLTIESGGQLQVRTTGGAVATATNLVMAGGTLFAGTGADVTNILDGTVEIQTNTTISGYWSDSAGARNLEIRSAVSGAGEIASTASNSSSTHELIVGNAANTYAGKWISNAGTLLFRNAGAVGTADIEVKANGKLKIEGNWNQAFNGAALAVADSAAASVDIGGYDWVVAQLSFGSVDVPEGTYAAAELNAMGANAVFTGSGSVTVGAVVPVVTMDVLGSAQTWTTATIWDNDLAPSGEYAYVVPATGNLTSPDGSSVFPGDSLIVEGGGKVQFRGKEEYGAATTINNLILSGGTEAQPVSLAAGTGINTVNVLQGSVFNDGYTILSGYWSDSGPRNLRISATIGGDGTFYSTASSASTTHSATIDNPANTFSGLWMSNRGTLVFESPGAVGAASIEVLGSGKLEIQGNWQPTNEVSLTVADSAAAGVDLGAYTWSVPNVTIGSTVLEDGTYSVSELNALGGAVFAGTGTLVVGTPVPPMLETEWGGGELTFAWSEGGYRLQCNTNGLASGDWFDVPGGDTSPVSVLPEDELGFFRLIAE
ncbi:autotransporter outer membrane beta-barrel domain-containing protein [Pontiella desulfatans]|nr:hypothetical protein [Pontiella desulfatans]